MRVAYFTMLCMMAAVLSFLFIQISARILHISMDNYHEHADTTTTSATSSSSPSLALPPLKGYPLRPLRVALCFWGITRNTVSRTIDSMKTHIIAALHNDLPEISSSSSSSSPPPPYPRLTIDTFLHTFRVTKKYSNKRSREVEEVYLNNEEYQLYNATVSAIDSQEAIDHTFHHYVEYRTHGDPWRHLASDDFTTLDNSIRALYSLDQVTRLWDTYGSQKLKEEKESSRGEIQEQEKGDKEEYYDMIIYARPDMLFQSSLRAHKWGIWDRLFFLRQQRQTDTNNESESVAPESIAAGAPSDPTPPTSPSDLEIFLPDFHSYPVNDRFAIASPQVARIYGHRLTSALDFSKQHELHAETFLHSHLRNSGVNKIWGIPICFHRLRTSGELWPDC